jgi:hypothetical protein
MLIEFIFLLIDNCLTISRAIAQGHAPASRVMQRKHRETQTLYERRSGIGGHGALGSLALAADADKPIKIGV